MEEYSSPLPISANRPGSRGKRTSQLPIPFKTFAADIDAAGLKIEKKIAAHWGISSRWFLVLSRKVA